MKHKNLLINTLKYVVLSLLALVVLIPIYYLIVTTFKSSTEAAITPMALPSSWNFDGYIEAFTAMQYPRAFRNTFIITFISVVGLVLVAAMCGYVLNRKEKYKITKIIIPIELEEAAKIDGASVFRTFWTITFPLMKPMIATVAILNTLTIWNDFIGPLYFLQSREKDVILQEVYRNIGQFSTDWSSLFPMMVLGVLPLVLFYLFMQKYIIGGVMSGSVKG